MDARMVGLMLGDDAVIALPFLAVSVSKQIIAFLRSQ